MDDKLSDAAAALFAEANFRSIMAGHEGFIPNYLLSEIDDHDPKVVDEIVAAGEWEDAEDGYQIANVLLVRDMMNKIANDPTPD